MEFGKGTNKSYVNKKKYGQFGDEKEKKEQKAIERRNYFSKGFEEEYEIINSRGKFCFRGGWKSDD